MPEPAPDVSPGGLDPRPTPQSLAAPASRSAAPARFRNYDVLRLVAASSVIFSHGFLIGQETEAHEPFKRLSGDILGLYGVFTFFIISGLLVTSSWMTRPGASGFLWRRFLRIVPAFVVCNLITLTLAGLFFYPGGTLLDFLRENAKPIIRHLTFIQGDGWFSGVHYYPHTADNSEGEVNGSIWSLQQELICYLLLALFASARWLKPIFVTLVLLVSTALLYRAMMFTNTYGPDNLFENFFYAIPPFSAGVLAWWLLQVHRPRLWIMSACIAAMAVALPFGKLMYVFPPAMAYLMLWLGVAAPFDLKMPRWLGDISYGVYLYGWPMEQGVKIAFGGHASVAAVIGFGFLGAVICGIASWRLVESPAMQLKGLVPATWSLDAEIASWWRRRRDASPSNL